MPKFHFSGGNSTRGLIGFCAVIEADDHKGAVARLKEMLPSEVILLWNQIYEPFKDGEYINVYFNPNAIKLIHIDHLVNEGDGNA